MNISNESTPDRGAPLLSNNHKYFLRSALFMGGYAFILIACFTGAFDNISSREGQLSLSTDRLILAFIAAIPSAGCLWASLSWMRHSDEFVRALSAKRFIVAAGISFALLSGWGFFEMVTNGPRFPLSLVLPLFWVIRGIVTPFVKTSH